MKKKEPVSTIMTKNIHVVKIEDKLADVHETIRKYGVRHVPVVHKKQLVGIISKTDLNRLTFSGLFPGEGEADEAILDMLTISQVMSNKPRVVRSDDSIRKVAEILAVEEFHALPVVDPEDEQMTMDNVAHCQLSIINCPLFKSCLKEFQCTLICIRSKLRIELRIAWIRKCVISFVRLGSQFLSG